MQEYVRNVWKLIGQEISGCKKDEVNREFRILYNEVLCDIDMISNVVIIVKYRKL
jgi:hypothetical protein